MAGSLFPSDQVLNADQMNSALHLLYEVINGNVLSNSWAFIGGGEPLPDRQRKGGGPRDLAFDHINDFK